MKNSLILLFFLLFAQVVSAQSPIPNIDELWYHQNPTSNFDTGIKRMMFPPPAAKDVLIAIIGSGVDTTHPFLQSTVSQNSERDFSQLNTIGKASDETGEGTHAAGIISSFSKYSPSALFKKLKILPLKVVRGKGPSFERQISLAIDHSIAAGSRVILLQESIHTFSQGMLKRSLERAKTNGILIIAPAGDRGQSYVSSPCLEASVICVGAIGKDGKTTSFSNRGASVDFSAPGDQILSSLPLNFKSQAGVTKGYGYKNSTQSSAAIIASFVAVIFALEPQVSRDEAYHRLVLAMNNGFPRLERILIPSSKDVPQVILKGSSDFFFKGNMLQVKFNVRNHGAHSNRFVLEYSSPHSHLQLKKTQEVLSFNQGEIEKEVSVDFKILDLAADHRISLDVKLSYFGVPYRTTISGRAFRDYPNSPIGTFEGVVSGSMKLLSGVNGTYLYSLDQTNILSFFQLKDGVFQKLGERLLLGSELPILESVRLVDLEDDGVDELFWITPKSVDLKTISFLTQALKAKYSFDYRTENVSLGLKGLNFMSHPFEGKKIKVPVFLSVGSVSKIDQQPGDFSAVDPDRHIYWLEPQKSSQSYVMINRTLTHERFREKILSSLGAHINSSLDLMVLKKTKTGFLALGGIKDSDGITQSGVSFEFSGADDQPIVRSIGFDRPLNEGGLLLPLETKGLPITKETLFVSAPSAHKLSLLRISGTDSPGSKVIPLGHIETLPNDEFLSFPIIERGAEQVNLWIQSLNTLKIFSLENGKKSYPLAEGAKVSPSLHRFEELFIDDGGRLTILKESQQSLVAPLKSAFKKSDCLFLGSDSSASFHACSSISSTDLYRIPIE